MLHITLLHWFFTFLISPVNELTTRIVIVVPTSSPIIPWRAHIDTLFLIVGRVINTRIFYVLIDPLILLIAIIGICKEKILPCIWISNRFVGCRRVMPNINIQLRFIKLGHLSFDRVWPTGVAGGLVVKLVVHVGLSNCARSPDNINAHLILKTSQVVCRKKLVN